MASLQDRIKNIEEFRPDISFKDGTFILKIKFKNGWTILEPEDGEKVAFAEDKNISNLYWYVSTIDDSDMIFDLIEETIAVNKEMEKKLDLYKQKVKELQELFLSSETYDRLLTLQFIIPEEKKKAKKTMKKSDLAKAGITDTAQSSSEMQKQANTATIDDKVYDNASIETSTPTDGILMASEVSSQISDIDKKIQEAIGE